MGLSPGTRLGSYEIVSSLGAGGMGEVYRARDARLGRDVAVKVLPAHVARDPEARQRFEREARTLAAISHPHICPVYDVGHQDGIDFLVMECLEGEPLSDRLARGPLPLEQALRYGIEIADALDKAHRKGVVHRDLKPGNVVLTRSGATLLDFGLAKLTGAGRAGGAGGDVTDLSMLPTTPPNLTVQGTILGTFQYMSPEQLEGREADARTDIFAFGAVLYEMVTGRKAFEGKSQASLISAIMSSEPPSISELQPVAPAALDQLVRTCLAKDPDERWQTAGDVERQLKWIASARTSAAGPVPASSPPRRARRIAAAVALVAAGAVAASAATWILVRRDPAQPQRLSVVAPAAYPVYTGGSPSLGLAISPDGRQIAYVAQTSDPSRGEQPLRLVLRSLADRTVVPVAGTDGVRQPFYSPDGRWVAFFTLAGELKKVAIAGGRPITLLQNTPGAAWSFGTWLPDDTIVFGGISSEGLRRVSANGGALQTVTTVDAGGQVSHLSPDAIGNDAVLFGVLGAAREELGIEAVRLATGERIPIVGNASGPLYLSPGHLLFKRDDVVMVAPFDAAALRITGTAVPLIDQVAFDGATLDSVIPQYAVSSDGALAYIAGGGADRTLGRVAHDGSFEPLGIPPGRYTRPRVSPDGRYVVFEVERGRDAGLHVYDIGRGTSTPLTRARDIGAVWRPDSLAVAAFRDQDDGRGIHVHDLAGESRLLLPTPPGRRVMFRTGSWSPDGRSLVYAHQVLLEHDLWFVSPDAAPAARQLTQTETAEMIPSFSPDGRWLAYTEGTAVGLTNVYVRRFPDGERRAVSTDGGFGPVWSRDGRQLHYVNEATGVPVMMTVPIVASGETLRIGPARRLFSLRVPGPGGAVDEYVGSSNAGTNYDVLPDGRFLMIKGPGASGAREIVIVQNFLDEARRLTSP